MLLAAIEIVTYVYIELITPEAMCRNCDFTDE